MAADPDSHAVGSYMSIDAGISVIPKKRYCDLTGFSGTYMEKKSKMNYCFPEFYEIICDLPEGVKDEHLSLRKANVILK